jgi:hypothetical protein
MRLQPPPWFLARQSCPCMPHCPGRLLFITCPNCGAVLITCNEAGTVFPDPHTLQQGPWLVRQDEGVSSAENECPYCHVSALTDFRYATSHEIQASGFKPGDYE